MKQWLRKNDRTEQGPLVVLYPAPGTLQDERRLLALLHGGEASVHYRPGGGLEKEYPPPPPAGDRRPQLITTRKNAHPRLAGAGGES